MQRVRQGGEVCGPAFGVADQRAAEQHFERVRDAGGVVGGLTHAWTDHVAGDQLVEHGTDAEHAGASARGGLSSLLGGQARAVTRFGGYRGGLLFDQPRATWVVGDGGRMDEH